MITPTLPPSAAFNVGAGTNGPEAANRCGPPRRRPGGCRTYASVIRVLALATALVLAPFATPAMVRYVDAHVDVPYLRDCHGLFRHLDECKIPGR